MDKQMPYIDVIEYCSSEKTEINTFYNMWKPWKHYAKWNKPDTRAIYYVIPFIGNIQNRQLHKR